MFADLLQRRFELPFSFMAGDFKPLQALVGLAHSVFLAADLSLLCFEQPRSAIDLGLQVFGMAAQTMDLAQYRGRSCHRISPWASGRRQPPDDSWAM